MATDTQSGRLVTAVTGALGELAATPAAALALTYAEQIDACTHVRLALDKALSLLARAVESAEESDPLTYAGASDAHAKVTAALSAVTVTADLGPKLLASLDALLLTPKAVAGISKGLPVPPATPANPIDEISAQEDEVAKKRRERGRTG